MVISQTFAMCDVSEQEVRSPDFTFASKQRYSEDVLKSSLCQLCKIYVISASKLFHFDGFHLVMVPELKATFIVTNRQSFVGVMLGYYASPRGGMLEVGSGEISAELNRALIDALVSGWTCWSHCLSAYSMLFELPAGLDSTAGWLTFVFGGTRDRLLVHGQRPSCVTQAGQYMSWWWLSCHKAF